MGNAAEASRSGDLLNDTYELTELIDESELHQSYRARDTVNDRVVRVALLRPELALRAGVAQRFTQTPKTLAQIEHPNLRRVIAVETDMSGIPFVVEEDLGEGQTLAKMLESFPEGMPLGVAMNLLAPIVEAVAAVHARGLGHGSIDAEHVVLASIAGSSVPKLVGLGAQEMRGDLRGDVRAMGALLYRALSGQAPAAGKRYTPLDELAPHLPHELTELVERCLGPVDVRPSHAVLVSDQLSEIRQRLGGRSSVVSPQVAKTPTPQVAKTPTPQVAKTPSPIATSAVREVEKRASQPAPPQRRAIERAATEPLSTSAFAATAYDEGVAIEDERPAVEVSPAAPLDAATAATVVDDDVMSIESSALAASPPSTISHAITERPPPEPARSEAKPRTHEPEPDHGFPMAEPSVEPSAERVAEPAAEPEPAAAKAEEPAAETKQDKAAKPSKPKKGKGKRGEAKDEPRSSEKKDALAAAFGPLDGASEIGQQESQESELARIWRKQMDKPQAAPGKPMLLAAGNTPAKQAEAIKKATDKPLASKTPAANPAVLLLTQHYAEQEARKKRFAGVLNTALLLLFAFLLLKGVPLVQEAPREQLATLIGPAWKIITPAFAGLSTVVLVQTWAMQIRTPSLVSKALTWTLKIVTLAIALVVASYFLPAGALGPAEAFGRRVLPWGAFGFFFAFAGFGLSRGMELAQSNAALGMAFAMLFSSGFYGSFAIAKNVLIPGSKKKTQHEITAEVAAELGIDPALAEQQAGDPGTVGVDAPTAAESGIQDRNIVGGSEEADLQAIEAMGNARKHNSAKLNELNEKIDTLRRTE